MARPKKAISASQVESLAKIGCTVSEIAAVMNCDKRRLNVVLSQSYKGDGSDLKRAYDATKSKQPPAGT